MKYLLGLKQLPFKQSIKQVIYVENEYDEDVNRYIQVNYERITQHFKSKGYDFCYIPYLNKELAESASIRYYAPFSPADFKPVADLKSDFILNWMVNQEKRNCIKPSLLYFHPYSNLTDYKEAVCQFRGITLQDSDYKKTNDLSNILEEIHQAIIYYKNLTPRFHLVSKEEADEFYKNLSEDKKARLRLLTEIAAEFQQDGVRCAMLDYYTHGQPKISPMRVTKDYRILIADREIHLAAKSKALYLLFLNHNHGIHFKELGFYVTELQDIYLRLKKRDELPEDMKNSITSVAIIGGETSWHLNCIRKEFNAVFEEHISSNYTIEGEQNEERYIKLSRDLVIWECNMPNPIPRPKRVEGSHNRNWYNE